MRNLKTFPYMRAVVLALIVLALALSGCVRTVMPIVTPTPESAAPDIPTPTEEAAV